ncbi:MAG: NADH-quinone oxidoreductase subunit C [Deferribacterales bacterium]
MTFEQLVQNLDAQFSGKLNCYTEYKCNFIKVKDASVYKEVLKALKNDASFLYIVDVVATHWPKKKEKFEITVNLFSIQNKLRIFVKVAGEDNKFPSITDIWKGADLMEREQYDLMGIIFEGHPNLKRVLLPEFFEGHPLRKDFPLKERAWFNNADEQGLGLKFSR